MLDEVDAFDHIGIPCDFREVDKEAEELDQDTDAGGLRGLLGAVMMDLELSKAYRNGYE
jgi:hypothetical protein